MSQLNHPVDSRLVLPLERKIGYIPTKKQFVSILNKLRDQNDAAMEVDHMMKSQQGFSEVVDFFSADALVASNVSTVVDLLDTVFNSFDLVGYFCFEIDYGRDWHPGCFTDEGEDINISDAEHLYDYLVLQLTEEKMSEK